MLARAASSMAGAASAVVAPIATLVRTASGRLMRGGQAPTVVAQPVQTTTTVQTVVTTTVNVS